MTLERLPIELLERIAFFLPQDIDVCNYASSSHQINNAINHVHAGIWRQLFSALYDLPPGMSGPEVKKQYKIRSILLRRNNPFQNGRTSQERALLNVVRDLIIESFADNCRSSCGTLISKNIRQLRYFTRKSNILQSVFQIIRSQGINPFLQAIQLLLFPLSIEFHLDCPTYGFPITQQIVYSHRYIAPIFLDNEKNKVNINLMLHIGTFFKYHMTLEEEATLFNPFQDLNNDEKPSVWCGRLKKGPTKLGRKWKGSSSYLHTMRDYKTIRYNEPGEQVVIDTITASDEGFQTLELDFPTSKAKLWPEAFCYLNSYPAIDPQDDNPTNKNLGLSAVAHQPKNHAAITTTSTLLPPSPPPTPGTTPSGTPRNRYFQFTGKGVDEDEYRCAGIVHPLPPQHGIPGWQRITIMKKYDPSFSSSSSSSDHSAAATTQSTAWLQHPIDRELDDNCWAYEGVVLPGGMIMLGRWWSATDISEERLCTGPWIFWNVPG